MEMSSYVLGALAAFVILTAAWWGIRRRRQNQIVEGAVASLEERARAQDPAVERSRAEEEKSLRKPSFYRVPALALILTSVAILVALAVLFAENWLLPYPLPEIGRSYQFSYRAPVEFVWEGTRIQRRQLLLPAGTRTTANHRLRIEAARDHRHQLDLRALAGTALLLAMFFLVLLYHMNIIFPRSTEKNKLLLLLYLAMLAMMMVAKASIFYGVLSPYLIPIPFAGMLITVFLNRKIVPLTVLMTCILVVLEAGFEMHLFLVLLAGGLVSGTWMRRARHRNEVMLAALGVGIIMALTWAALQMVDPTAEISLQGMGIPFLNGIVSGLLLMIALPLLESIFDLASPFRLMELLDLNTPLLKRLFFAAPGTYQHSMAVANMAEMVASQIGANDLLVRAGSYYHDIGKIFSPQHFVENQGGDNPHDEMGPVASAAVIRSHVILGLQLGRRVGLPSVILDFVAEHHGTSTIDYFFHKARSLESEIRSERIFKYPGPRPRSKETAIVMLVDSTEAASRTLQQRDEESIRKLVEGIVQRKLAQGQLDESGLTLGELKTISENLAHILKTVAHQRIDYPAAALPVQQQGSGKEA